MLAAAIHCCFLALYEGSLVHKLMLSQLLMFGKIKEVECTSGGSKPTPEDPAEITQQIENRGLVQVPQQFEIFLSNPNLTAPLGRCLVDVLCIPYKVQLF